jgi:hypothetical protein
MSKYFISAMASCFLLALLSAAPAGAQTGTLERAVIPFDFIVRGKTLPAGTYSIRRINDTSEALVIQSQNLRSHVAFETEPFEARLAPSRSELVFHRYGDTYFLREIRTGGEAEGRELATSRAERDLKRETAENKVAEPETVAVALY